MQLFTFGIDRDKNLIIQFPVFVQPYTQQPQILYQLETVHVPIIDQNTQVHSYTQFQIEKPYVTHMKFRENLGNCLVLGI